jgi:RimJ/RimL family protein N-acetyltransferase
MKGVVVNADMPVAAFMRERFELNDAFNAGRGIGVVDMAADGSGELIAGIWFESFNGANINMHVAAKPGARWMNKEVLWYAFYYPFVECNVRRITGLVAASNIHAQKFDEKIGFKLEARLKDAAPDGDMLVYVMFREDCRWLKLRERIPHIRNKVN